METTIGLYRDYFKDPFSGPILEVSLLWVPPCIGPATTPKP